MITKLELSGYIFEVVYKDIKTIRITLYPLDGRIKITAPAGTTQESVRKFAKSKIAWVEKHRQRLQSHTSKTGSLRNHSTVYVWGEAYRLEIIEHYGNSTVRTDGGSLIMKVRPDSTKAKKQELLDRWYSRILKKAAPAVIQKWETILKVKVKKLFVRKMRTRWGSCNYGKQTLRLNSELAKRSPECLEYVIVHEMLHIFEKGHNRNFYTLLARYIPSWKIIRKKMNAGDL